MAKGIFIKYRGSMTKKELEVAIQGMGFKDNSRDILHQFFVKGKNAGEMGYPKNRVNNTIDRFLSNLAKKDVHIESV